MAKYTTQVRSICESYAGLEESGGFGDIKDIISASKDKIFGDYPIFDEEYRSVLNTKILTHYYMREIGMETVGLWKHYLNMRMNEIMPYYNKLYESELLEFNPLYDVDYKKTGTRDGQKTGSETGESLVNGNVKTTGTVTDDKIENKTDAMTGNVKDENTADKTNTMTGTVADSSNNIKTDKMTGTVLEDNESFNDDRTTGTIKDEGANESLRTDNLQNTSTDGGTEGVATSTANKNDHWDYFNDTPQGSVQNLADLTYLTNARHITDDGTGSTSNQTTTFGKTNTGTNTGTVKNEGSDENTRTYNTDEKNTSTDENTKTYDTLNTMTDDGEAIKTYDTKNSETGSGESTKTYDTLNTVDGTGQDIKTYDTDVDKSEKGVTNKQTDLNTTEDYAEHVVGKIAGKSYTQLLMEFRESFLNIDMLIIRDLNDLFFGLWE